MNIYHYCMTFLLLCLLILEGIRWFSFWPDKGEAEGIDIAKSMTIGSRETQSNK